MEGSFPDGTFTKRIPPDSIPGLFIHKTGRFYWLVILIEPGWIKDYTEDSHSESTVNRELQDMVRGMAGSSFNVLIHVPGFQVNMFRQPVSEGCIKPVLVKGVVVGVFLFGYIQKHFILQGSKKSITERLLLF
jgi:hypothetical protein